MLYFFLLLQAQLHIHITVCFFFPQCGHNAADCHNGSTKKHLQFVLKCLADSYFVADRKLLVDGLQECKLTTMVNLPPIQTHQKIVDTLTGMTDFLVFEFPQGNGLDVDCCWLFGGSVVKKRFSLLQKNK